MPNVDVGRFNLAGRQTRPVFCGRFSRRRDTARCKIPKAQVEPRRISARSRGGGGPGSDLLHRERTGARPRFLAGERHLCLATFEEGYLETLHVIWADTVTRLIFADNGIGIPKETHERLFKLFQRLDKRYEGTGVGLTVVCKAMEKLGGRVDLESEPGQGSRFWLELSVANP